MKPVHSASFPNHPRHFQQQYIYTYVTIIVSDSSNVVQHPFINSIYSLNSFKIDNIKKKKKKKLSMSNQLQKWLRDPSNPNKVMCHLCGRGNLDPKKFSNRHLNTEHPGYSYVGVTRDIVLLQNNDRILREKTLAEHISNGDVEKEVLEYSRKRSRVNDDENNLHALPSATKLYASTTAAEMESQMLQLDGNEISNNVLQEVMNDLIAEGFPSEAVTATPTHHNIEMLMENINYLPDIEVRNLDPSENEKQGTEICYWKNGVRYWANLNEVAGKGDNIVEADNVVKDVNSTAGNKTIQQFENNSESSNPLDLLAFSTMGQSIIVFFARHSDDGCLIVQDLCTDRNWEYKLQLSNLAPSTEIVTAIQQWKEDNKIFSKNLETILHCQVSIFGNINLTTFPNVELPSFKLLPTSLSDQELEDLVTNFDNYFAKDETDEIDTEDECIFDKHLAQPLRDMLPTLLRLRGGAELALINDNNEEDPQEHDSNDQQAYGGKKLSETLQLIPALP